MHGDGQQSFQDGESAEEHEINHQPPASPQFALVPKNLLKNAQVATRWRQQGSLRDWFEYFVILFEGHVFTLVRRVRHNV